MRDSCEGQDNFQRLISQQKNGTELNKNKNPCIVVFAISEGWLVGCAFYVERHKCKILTALPNASILQGGTVFTGTHSKVNIHIIATLIFQPSLLCQIMKLNAPWLWVPFLLCSLTLLHLASFMTNFLSPCTWLPSLGAEIQGYCSVISFWSRCLARPRLKSQNQIVYL